MRASKDLSGKASSGSSRRGYMQAYAKGVNKGNSLTKVALPQEPKVDLGAFTQGTQGTGSSRNYGKETGAGGQAPKKGLDAMSFNALPRHIDLFAATTEKPAGLEKGSALPRMPGPAKIKSF